MLLGAGQQEVRRYEGLIKRQELEALQSDVNALRSEMLALEDEAKRAQVRICRTSNTLRGGAQARQVVGCIPS